MQQRIDKMTPVSVRERLLGALWGIVAGTISYDLLPGLEIGILTCIEVSTKTEAATTTTTTSTATDTDTDTGS